MKLTIDRVAPNFVLLRDDNGAWVGPVLGDFKNARTAIRWAHTNGHSVIGVSRVPDCLTDIVSKVNATRATVALV